MADVKEGDLVVTAGLDGIYPKGLPVGRVTVVERAGPPYRRVLVAPVVDFSSLETVLVVLTPTDAAARGRRVKRDPSRGGDRARGPGRRRACWLARLRGRALFVDLPLVAVVYAALSGGQRRRPAGAARVAGLAQDAMRGGVWASAASRRASRGFSRASSARSSS